ncbi:MAG: hypothetical protein QOH93_610 [Chloroflexia bacterium]|jgi:hypothetical protein|nr:hypothetical protein [Chloroflexia bacterium]
MTDPSNQIGVYLEIGSKRTLAGALDWPGWCRGGRDVEAALQALIDYGPRYERVLRAAVLQFQAPANASDMVVVERVAGNTTTDFGAPDVPPSGDTAPVDDVELVRLQELLKACWLAFDAAAQATEGKELRKGPRGGGRDLQGIVRHVVEAEASYLTRLGGKRPNQGHDAVDVSLLVERQRQAILDTLAVAGRGELPLEGPRGGSRWTPRFFVRRDAWHVLDHVWEIEDRVL